jgi:hypothetical protein
LREKVKPSIVINKKDPFNMGRKKTGNGKKGQASVGVGQGGSRVGQMGREQTSIGRRSAGQIIPNIPPCVLCKKREKGMII